MASRFDIAIVGAGLAGACAALWLSKSRSVVLLEAKTPSSGASGVAAGLINPIKGIRATPMWRMDEALDALRSTLEESGVAHLFDQRGVFRPARDEKQKSTFQTSAEQHRKHATWLSSTEAAVRYGGVEAPFGGMIVRSGGLVPMPQMIDAALTQAAKCGAQLHSNTELSNWRVRSDHVVLNTSRGSFETKTLLLCLGAGYDRFPQLASLPLHQIKGQAIRLSRPSELSKDLPAISSGIYVVPDGNTLLVGATFEHTFQDIQPDPAQSDVLKAKATELIPILAQSEILDAQAGIRVTVPKVRLPLLTPLPENKRVWIFSGLGAKGLMTAPLLARQLAGYLDNPETLPIEVRTSG